MAVVVAIATTVTATVAPPTSGAAAAGRLAARAAALGSLRALAGGRADVHVRSTTGAVTFVGGPAGRPLTPPSRDGSVTVARRFLHPAAAAFGVDDPAELAETRVVDGVDGTSSVRFQQRIDSVPVLAGEIAVQLDAAGSVRSASGETSPSTGLDVAPTVAPSAAAATAVDLAARADHVAADAIAASTPELWIYDPTLLGAPSARGTRLVWRVQVRSTIGDVDRLVLVDAHDATVALQFSQRDEARDRQVCDDAGGASQTCAAPVRSEGQGPVASAEVNAAYDLSGVTYDFYSSVLGRDSLDGAGMTLRSTVNYSPNGQPYQNAFWSGTQMVYGAGYASADDIVGHELTHGVTQFTSGLLYFAESGAINESMSDVMGELIDQWSTLSGADANADRWLVGEQLPGGGIRSMADPPAFGDPDRMTSALFSGALADSHGVHTNSGVGNKAAYLMVEGTAGEPGGAFNGRTITGLGLLKTARIYYQAQTTLLGPGSDYGDLGVALPQACNNLVGVGGIVADDCAQVGKVVLATEMDLRPTSAGAWLTAPVCGAGTVRTSTRFADDMESNTANWTTSSTGGAATWGYATGTSQSGVRSVHVSDPTGPRGISSLTMAAGAAFTVPAGTTTYLRFDHAFETDWDANGMYDGGVVEYSTDNGSSWTDVGQLGWTDNGYPTSLSTVASGGLTNQLAPRPAFGRISPGFQTSRADLSSLAGATVRLRFRFASDNYPDGAYAGWFVDDLAVYTCAPPPPTTTTTTPPPTTTTIPAETTTTTTTATTTTATTTTTTTTTTGPTAGAAYAPVVPARVLDTRSGPDAVTVDGGFVGGGVRGAGSTLVLPVAGRGGVPADASAVVLNVTVTGSSGAGFVTVFPCGGSRPNASNVNHGVGQTIPNLVISGVGVGGAVCLFTSAATHLIVDVDGYQPAAAGYRALTPARLLDTRTDPDLATIDTAFLGIGPRAGGTVLALQVAGRAGVPDDARAVVLNVAVTGSAAPGFVTVFPCGAPRPNASNLNHDAGQTIANLVVAGMGTGGTVCLFTLVDAQLVVDVAGFVPAGSTLTPVVPARVLDTRSGPDAVTVDGGFVGGGVRGAGSTLVLPVAGRGGVPADASAVVLNVTVTGSSGAGFVTVFPCGGSRPNASNVNHGVGQTIPNLVISGVGVGGAVCLFTSAVTHLIVDVDGYQPA